MADSDVYYIVVSASYKGVIKSVELFDSYHKAVGYAQTKYGPGDEVLDETIVYEVNPPEDVGRPVYNVEMQQHKYDPEDDDEYEIVTEEKPPINLSDTFELVDARSTYGGSNLPSTRKVRGLKKGAVVQVAVSTPDSYEKCWVVIEKVYSRRVKRKRESRKRLVQRFVGVLMDIPETFSPPNNMKITFNPENIIDIDD
jgi:hypothetical protein